MPGKACRVLLVVSFAVLLDRVRDRSSSAFNDETINLLHQEKSNQALVKEIMNNSVYSEAITQVVIDQFKNS